MSELLTYDTRDGVALLTINNPPVNALSQAVRQAIADAMDRAEADGEIVAVVIQGQGRLFCAGADIREFDAPVKQPGLPGLIDRVEGSTKPVVVAIHGTTLGGGFELSMGCHYRIADRDANVGLPEVHLGLIPGAGGTQRLPRLVGAEAAIEAITSGRHIPVEEAKTLGAIDEVVAGDLTAAAVTAALRLADGPMPTAMNARQVDTKTPIAGLLEVAKQKLAKTRRGFDAPVAAIDAIEWACTLPLAAGLEKERVLSTKLKASVQSKAQRHLFFSERQALKIPDISVDTKHREIRSAAVIGAGTMGVGITVCLLNAGLPVTLTDTTSEALERGLARVKTTLERDVERGRLSPELRDDRLSRLHSDLSLDGLGRVDLVIEAVFESLDLKVQIFSALGQVCRADAILATNTSTLDIDQIAQAVINPERVIGTHFFSPANVMKLLEVVRGHQTADDVVATLMSFGKRIGKTAVLSRVGYGFIGNRMLEDYVRESQMLLLEGARPSQVDGALEAWGMAMGPCAVMDLAGQDVSFLTRDQNRHLLPDDPRYCAPGDLMNAAGRFGQKTGTGFYHYPDGRTRQDDPVAESMILEAAADMGVDQRTNIEESEIRERCLYVLINRGAQLLEDGIALRASDIDVVWSAGYGFPAYRGGPMFFADTIGLNTVIDAFGRFADQFGNPYGYWTPAPLLDRLASEGRSFADFDATN